LIAGVIVTADILWDARDSPQTNSVRKAAFSNYNTPERGSPPEAIAPPRHRREENMTDFGTKLRCRVCLIAIASFMAGHADQLRAAGPEPVRLWPDGAPGAVGTEDVDRPAVRIYQPDEAARSDAAILVCPGGGYGVLASDHEGQQVAKWLNTIGVTAVVLKYRLGPRYHHPAPLNDARRAMRYIRAHAADLEIAPDRVGVMGFSAGGHLASTLSTHFDAGHADSADPIERESCRPDFAVLAYPVISLTADFSHRGSARNLLGDNPDPELLKSLSNETQVTDQTPPTFLFHTGADKGVPVQNSLVYYRALLEHGVPAELHVYQSGPHGVGLAPGDPVLSTWKERLAAWLKGSGFLEAGERAEVRGRVSVDGQPLRWGTITLLPRDNELLPSAFAMVSQGEYAFPKSSGPVVGDYTVVVYDLGGVVAEPTIDDAALLTRPAEIQFQVARGANSFDVNLRRRR
jgi:acetyl esterase/lipase